METDYWITKFWRLQRDKNYILQKYVAKLRAILQNKEDPRNKLNYH